MRKLAFTLFIFSLSALAADLKSSIRPIKQEGNNCYGAVAQEILRLNGITATQRQISVKAQENNQFTGDDYKGTDLKNSGGSPIDVLRYYGLKTDSRGYYPDPITVREVLGRGDALALSVGNMSGGHALLMFGISDDNAKFWIWDPATGNQHLMSMRQVETTWGGYNYYAWVERTGVRTTPPRAIYRKDLGTESYAPPVPQPTTIARPTYVPPVPPPSPRQPTSVPYSPPVAPQPNSWFHTNRVIVSDPQLVDLQKRLDKLNNVK